MTIATGSQQPSEQYKRPNEDTKQTDWGKQDWYEQSLNWVPAPISDLCPRMADNRDTKSQNGERDEDIDGS
jgi:hypothetical protein